MNRYLQKIYSYFSMDPPSSTAIQITSRYISGINLSPKDRTLKNHFILPLEESTVLPSYSGINIQDKAGLEQAVRKGKKKLGFNGRKTALLLPDLCQRLFVFSFDSLPASRLDKAKVIRFRVKKQMPMLADDSRLAFQVIKTSDRYRVIVSIAKNTVVREYEDILSTAGIDVGMVSPPVLGLYHCVD